MKYLLSIVAIFKNEADIIQEWIEHYVAEGVDHFYLIDNGSDDNYRKIIEPYINEGIIDLNVDTRPHMQIEHYNYYYLDKVKTESEWVMVVDLDEFIYSRLKFNKISDFLSVRPIDISQIYVPWKLFGSNGHIQQPAGCVEHFTMRTRYNHVKTNGMSDSERILTKTIIRTKYLKKMCIHSAQISDQPSKMVLSNGQIVTKTTDECQPTNEQILQTSYLHCNHYPIQSFQWFKKIKMNRGSANVVANDKIRTIAYYNSFDGHSNQLLDQELALKRNKLKICYGIDNGNGNYYDVTRLVVKKFTGPDGHRITINNDINFNDCFGDPSPGQTKYLIVYQNHNLKIYDELNHGPIVINY